MLAEDRSDRPRQKVRAAGKVDTTKAVQPDSIDLLWVNISRNRPLLKGMGNFEAKH